MSPYRGGVAAELSCPRCGKPLPPLDVATCDCGTWLTAFAARHLLTDEERRANRVTRWWRVRAPCPMCGEKMLLRGVEPGLFQGCDGHGYWIDADTVEHTSLAGGVDLEELERKREDPEVVEAVREERERAELGRAAEREQKERANAQAREAERAAEGRRRTIADEYRHAAENEHLATASPLSRHLLGRIIDLEARNAALEARVAALEEALRGRWSPTS
jgi:predicted RNA-binding Zn-ribbon protein involved in translation (DUF1610 family)